MKNTPKHYQNELEPIEVINKINANFNVANVIKYLYRLNKKHKGNKQLEDLDKAINYLTYEIKNREQIILEINENWNDLNKEVKKSIITLINPTTEITILHHLELIKKELIKSKS